MKNILKMFLVIFIVFNIMASIVITIVDIYSNRYFNEYENLQSFKNEKLFMIDDFLFIERGNQYTGADNGVGSYIIEGVLLSDNSKIELAIGKEEFLGANLDKQPLYRSKLTGDFFLRNASKEYYNSQFFSFYMGIYIKFSFFIIITIMLYITVQYVRETKNIEFETPMLARASCS